MTGKKRDQEAAEQLSAAVGRVAGQTKVERVAGLGYLQSTITQAGVQALVNLLKSKNIISDSEIERALAVAYEERFKQLSGSQAAILTPAPLVRPQ